MKRATSICRFAIVKVAISIHALVKRATITRLDVQIWHGHFNPRPREEGDLFFLRQYSTVYSISIHALVKRATHRFVTAGEVAVISIHALVKRATMPVAVFKPCAHDFNPRPREEGDASTVGYKPQSDDFNPRPREEGDKPL